VSVNTHTPQLGVCEQDPSSPPTPQLGSNQIRANPWHKPSVTCLKLTRHGSVTECSKNMRQVPSVTEQAYISFSQR